MKKKKKRNLWVWILGAGIVLAVGGFFAYRSYTNGQAAAAGQIQTASVRRGSLTSTLGASGTARSGQSATLTWETSGKAQAVSLQPGDTVQEGQELAALDPTTLPSSMLNAKQTLIDAQQNLDDLQNSKLKQAQALQAVQDAQQALDDLKHTAAENLSQAQSTLATAQQALDDAQRKRTAMNYPHTTDKLIIEKAQTDYLLAKQNYKEALQQYDKYKSKKLTNQDRVRALNNLVNAKQKMDTAFATYNWYLLGYTDNQIAQGDADLAVAQANLDKAQADYDNLKNNDNSAAVMLAEATLSDAQRAWDRVKDGPNPDDIAAAQAAVDAAQATLDQAHILAPFAGTITEVDVKTGDIISSGKTAFRIDDLSSIYIDLQVSEVDISSLQLGQTATLTFDAISDKQYTGEVVDIGMVGSVSQGVVNYPVTVRVTDADAAVRPGMTAAVDIVTAQHDNVLLVPNQAVRTGAGGRTVTVLFQGQEIPVQVNVGLTNDTMSEVTSDQLREGDQVILNSSVATSGSTQGRNNFGPGGFGGGGGNFFRGP